MILLKLLLMILGKKETEFAAQQLPAEMVIAAAVPVCEQQYIDSSKQ
jgi:hypothetical protein